MNIENNQNFISIYVNVIYLFVQIIHTHVTIHFLYYLFHSSRRVIPMQKLYGYENRMSFFSKLMLIN